MCTVHPARARYLEVVTEKNAQGPLNLVVEILSHGTLAVVPPDPRVSLRAAG